MKLRRFHTFVPRVLCIGVIVLSGCSSKKTPATSKKVFVLGCDGMDPKLVGRMMAEGRLPNFSKLAARGSFKPLTTSIPPQSPVAWSNFITGADPGVHGIFDFIHRDPTKQVEPYFSTNRIETTKEKDPWKLGSYQLPRSEVANRLLRKGTPFWDFLDAAGVPVEMYHLPANYPPSESGHGHVCCLSGMGVPDAFGSQGTYQQFTSAPRPEVRGLEGGMRLRMKQAGSKGAWTALLNGPPNEFRRNAPPMTVAVHVYPDKTRDVAKIRFVDTGVFSDDTTDLVLNAGEWSDWKEIHFLKTPAGPAFGTMVRFYLQRVHPEIELYVTPLNFIPTKPEAIFSEPPGFVEEIGTAIGPFYTQGFAEAFNARKHETLSDEEYRIQADQVFEDSRKMLDYALDRYTGGLLFFYFSSTDLQAHIFYWDSDDKHPVRSAEMAKKYMGVIEDLYIRVDQTLGRAMERLGDEVLAIVMSDHGFTRFSRCFGLNKWLRDEGYLSAKTDILRDADWTTSRAYGFGLNGLYVNLKGREVKGTVDPSQRSTLLDEIRAKLLAVRDPETGKPVIRTVYRTDECYHGPETANAPDLIIGYERGYRASWKTCLGTLDSALIFPNDQAWSADHCIAHDMVPGIILSNQRITLDGPALIDIAPTVLAEFGISRPAYMTGTSLFGARK